MAKSRVHELAKEFGVDSREILISLRELGEFVKSASSTIEGPTERRLRNYLQSKNTSASGKRASTAPAVYLPSPGPQQQSSARGTTHQPPSFAEQQAARESTDLSKPSHGAAVESGEAGKSDRNSRMGSPQADAPSFGSTLGPTGPTRVTREVAITSLSSDRDVRTILRECKQARRSTERLSFDLSDARGFYPSAAVPAVAIVQHFRRAGVSVDFKNLPPIAETMAIRNPLEASKTNLDELHEPLSRMWVYFDHHQASALTTSFMECIRRKVECREGVLEALEWCLMEMLDNVTQHSKSEAGFAMLQLHTSSKRLAVCVSDTGIGVQRSLASSVQHKPATAFDALTLAIREGVTRNDKTNQGNGLFGLKQILEQNGGRMQLASGRGRMLLQGDRFTGGNDQDFIGPENHGTTVDFQLQVDKPVSLGDALNFDPPNMYLESIESEIGEHVISIRDQAGGSGSRKAARELKILIMNVLNDGAPHVVLDFEGQPVVSSSFADEVIGKMFAEMGFNVFNRRIKLFNMNPTVSSLIDRAIALRLSQRSN